MKHNARPITSRSRFQPADSPAKYNPSLVQGAADMYRAGGVQPIAAADPAEAEDPVVPAETPKLVLNTDTTAELLTPGHKGPLSESQTQEASENSKFNFTTAYPQEDEV